MNATRILPDLQCSLLCEEVRQDATAYEQVLEWKAWETPLCWWAEAGQVSALLTWPNEQEPPTQAAAVFADAETSGCRVVSIAQQVTGARQRWQLIRPASSPRTRAPQRPQS